MKTLSQKIVALDHLLEELFLEEPNDDALESHPAGDLIYQFYADLHNLKESMQELQKAGLSARADSDLETGKI